MYHQPDMVLCTGNFISMDSERTYSDLDGLFHYLEKSARNYGNCLYDLITRMIQFPRLRIQHAELGLNETTEQNRLRGKAAPRNRKIV